jgi:hypothetical protein
MAMRRRCEARDHVVSRLPFAVQRLAPVDARPARMNEPSLFALLGWSLDRAAVGSCTVKVWVHAP